MKEPLKVRASDRVAGMSGPDGPLLRLVRDRRLAFLIVGGVNTAVGFLWFVLFTFLFDAWWPDGPAWSVFAIIACATDQVQPVDATPPCWSKSSCSLNASAGVFQSSDLRGLVFSA